MFGHTTSSRCTQTVHVVSIVTLSPFQAYLCGWKPALRSFKMKLEYQTVDLKTHIMTTCNITWKVHRLTSLSFTIWLCLPVQIKTIQTKSIQQKTKLKTKIAIEQHLNVPDTTTTSASLLVGASHFEQSISVFSTSSPVATAMCCHTNWTASVRRPKFRRALAKFLSSINDAPPCDPKKTTKTGKKLEHKKNPLVLKQQSWDCCLSVSWI